MGLPDIETIPETGAVFTIGRSRFADNVASHFFIRKDPVVAITCGDEHSAVICQSGRLFIFGSNDWGQLGLGHKTHISKPSCVKILKPEKVTHVACGRAHTLICTGAQKIFACGSNQESQLGRENSAIGDSSSSPILIYDCGLAGPRILQVAAGSHHSMALMSDGGVIAWGSNLEGQLGLPGISGLVNKPTKVPVPEPVKEISAGYYHSAFLTENGLVYVCGESESGKLGIDVNFSTQVAPKQMQLPVPALHVICGGHHTLVLAENGNIYCCGSNANGQLGMGTNVSEIHTPKLLPRGTLQNEKVVKIACGESHSAILTESGKLFTCGDGRHGKLGLEENENNVHEVTFAAKYQELFVSNVSCGGCHTILIGRRHEMDYQSQKQPDAIQKEHSAQKRSALPPLKLPVNMQNEQQTDNVENKSTTSVKDDQRHIEKIREIPQTDDALANSPEDASIKNSDAVVDSSMKNESVASHDGATSEMISSGIPIAEVASTGGKDGKSDAESDLPNEKNIESDETETKSKDNRENDENTETEGTMERDVEESGVAPSDTRDEVEKETSTNSAVAPPKPPRLKSGSVKDASNEEESPMNQKDEDEAEEGEEETKTKSDERRSSVKSFSGKSKLSISRGSKADEIIEVIENSIEKLEGDGRAGESGEATEVDDAQDDADVVQSPAPRAGKMSKLLKAKHHQEAQNGTKKARGAANPKAKSKTCTVL